MSTSICLRTLSELRWPAVEQFGLLPHILGILTDGISQESLLNTHSTGVFGLNPPRSCDRFW